MELHVLKPVLDTGANCKRCSLNTQKKLNQVCFHYAPVPTNWNGIMVVGEGPGRSEVVEGRPFVGASGKLLRALFKSEGIDLDACYITNATLCRPHSHIKGGLMEQAPEAIQHCLPRLEREIQLVKPRVILALGGAALAALTGAEYKVTKRELFVCGYCDEKDRKVSGVQCAKGGCTGLWEGTDEAQKPQVCPVCAATWKRLKVRRVRCPKCSSRKMKDVEHTLFDWDYSITEVAGAVIPAEKHGWDEFGVKYIIATYHPSFLLRGGESSGSGEKKKMAGQFAAKTVTRHLRKVAHLLKADRPWGFEYEVTSETDDFDARDHLIEYVYQHNIKDPNFTIDVETEAWGTHYFCTACEKKSGIEQPIDWETAPILPSAACKKCGNDTHQVPQRGELDARVLENVTAINVIGFCDRRRGHALVVDTRNLATMPNLKEALRRVLTDAALKKTMHHGTYDVPVINKLWGIWVEGYCGENGGDDTLMQHHVLCPDESHTLSHLAFRYTFARVWKPPKQLKGHAAHQTFAELCEYNARDVWITDEVRCQMASEIVRKGTAAQVYALDKQLQEQALAMQQNGMPLNMDKARAVGATALKLKRDALTAMRDFARNPEFNPNSPEQLRDYLFVKQGYPVILWTDGGKSGNKQPSTAEDALLQLPDTPFKRALLEYREADGTLRAYFDVSTGSATPSRGMRIWGDGRLHATWKPFGARSGRFTTNPNCFDGETEVLTPDGWVRFDDIDMSNTATPIAQYDKDSGITFVRPDVWIKKRHVGQMVDIRTTATRLRVTPEHRCLLRHRKTGEHRVFLGEDYPEDWEQLHAAESPNHGILELHPAEITLLCATQADGHFTVAGRQVVFTFDKPRKKVRLEQALQTLDIAYTRKDFQEGTRDRTRFVVERSSLAVLRYLSAAKTFTWDLLALEPVSRRLFVDELGHWDGHHYYDVQPAPFTYSSSVKQNVDVAQALVCMAGYRVKVREYRSHPDANVNYQLDAVDRDSSLTTNREHTTISWDDDVYCVSVPSSFIVVRREGRIHITGQCQNWAKWMREMVEAEDGRVIVGADQAQLELRLTAALSGDATLLDKCINADENRKLEPDHDPHSFVASVAFGTVYTSLLLKDPAHDRLNNKCKCETCTRKAYRDLVKRVIYGLNYGAGDAKVLEAIYKGGYNGPSISIEMIGRIRAAIFRAFPGIPVWRNKMVREAGLKRAVFSPLLGRWRTFPLGDIPVTEIYNFGIQAGGADIMNILGTKFYQLSKKVDPTSLYFAQVHDAVYYEVDAKRADAFCDAMTETLSVKMALVKGGYEMPFVATAHKAQNWMEAA